jgi:hypothetical protein
VINEVPGKNLIKPPFPVDIEIGIDDGGLECLGPVPVVFLESGKQLGCATISS